MKVHISNLACILNQWNTFKWHQSQWLRDLYTKITNLFLCCCWGHSCFTNIPYSGKFSLGSYFRDFADRIRSRENKNRNNLFQQKFKGRFIWNRENKNHKNYFTQFYLQIAKIFVRESFPLYGMFYYFSHCKLSVTCRIVLLEFIDLGKRTNLYLLDIKILKCCNLTTIYFELNCINITSCLNSSVLWKDVLTHWN